jgi:hypothetical protein
MKRILLIIATAVFGSGVQAQPWIQPSDKPQKLEDIISAYKNNQNSFESEEEEYGDGIVERGEKKNHQFDRWVWYWQNHLDENGYMVPSSRTMEEWKKYQQKIKGTRYAKTTNQSQWEFKGPSTTAVTTAGTVGLGRINVISFHPTDTTTFIIGAAGGGCWRTTDGGITWQSLYDNLPVLGVSDVDYNPLNPNTIYLCTGDRDAGDTYSVGVLKSTDGGATWNATGLQYTISGTSTPLVNCLVINPLDTNSLMVATKAGILKSFDAGATWVNTIANGEYKQVVYHPTDTNIVYGATFAQGTSNIFRSGDGGMTWQQVTNLSDSRRIGLAVTPANPNIVKAIVANGNDGLQGIYSSSDTGHSFTKIYGSSNCNTNILNGSGSPSSSSCDGQGWYDLSIAMSPVDSNLIVIGGINTWRSLNGGVTWGIIAAAYGGAPGVQAVHADKHYHIFHPLKPSLLFEGNDGGIYRTTGPSHLLWNDLSNGLGITQFYRLAVADGATFVIGGAQDNGTKRVTFTGASNHLTGGDGMDCQFNYIDPNTFYTSSQYGKFNRTTNNGASYVNISNNISSPSPTGDWITPLVVNPVLPSIIYAGYDHVYMSPNEGSTWTDISPTFPTVGAKIRRMAMSASDVDRIYILASVGTLKYSDGNGTWTSIPTGYSGQVSDIMVDPKDKNHLWVTYGGYGNARVAEYRVGIGWALRNDSLPVVPVQCIAMDSSNGTLYIGTDVGVFYKDYTMHKWELYNNGLPNIEVTDLGVNYATNEIWASTYGRGMWKSPKHIAAPNSINSLPLALDVISVAPNPNRGQFNVSTTNKSLVDQNVTVRVVSYTGVTVMETSARFNSSGTLSVNTQNIARGSYLVEVSKGDMLFARTKMVSL